MGITRETPVGTALNEAINSKFKYLNVLKPGRILKYDPISQLADIEPMFTMTPPGGGKPCALPILYGVHVWHLRTRNFFIKFPVNIGDFVGLFFADSSFENFFGMINDKLPAVDPADPRSHSFSDAIAIPGLFPDCLGLLPGIGTPLSMEIGLNDDITQSKAELIFNPDGSILISTVLGTITITKTGAISFLATNFSVVSPLLLLTGVVGVGLDLATMILPTTEAALSKPKTFAKMMIDGIMALVAAHFTPTSPVTPAELEALELALEANYSLKVAIG